MTRLGTFLGDTVLKKAVIYRLDWARAWQDGNLDHAVRDVIDDDAATNGCRPTFVSVAGRTFLATSDYGDIHPEIRLLDPEALLAARRTSSRGVIVHHFRCGPFNQNMQWDGPSGLLTCVQNVIEGRGWRLDVLNLAKAVAAGDGMAEGVRSCARKRSLRTTSSKATGPSTGRRALWQWPAATTIWLSAQSGPLSRGRHHPARGDSGLAPQAQEFQRFTNCSRADAPRPESRHRLPERPVR